MKAALLNIRQKQGSLTYAVRITWLIADIEVRYHGTMGLCHAQPSLATQNPSKDSCFISHEESIHFYRLSHSELDDIEKVAVRSSL
ncbi:hypothetical protein Tco_0565002 [Tanacetum coccineum]